MIHSKCCLSHAGANFKRKLITAIIKEKFQILLYSSRLSSSFWNSFMRWNVEQLSMCRWMCLFCDGKEIRAFNFITLSERFLCMNRMHVFSPLSHELQFINKFSHEPFRFSVCIHIYAIRNHIKSIADIFPYTPQKWDNFFIKKCGVLKFFLEKTAWCYNKLRDAAV